MSSEKPITRERILRIFDGQAHKTAEFLAKLDVVDMEQLAREDGWTAKEVIAHVAVAHGGLRAMALGQAPPGFDPARFDLDSYNEVQRRRAAGLPVEEVLAWLDRARRQMRATIEQVDEAEYGEVVHTPWMGDHPRGQLLLFSALHEGGHRAELERAWASRQEPHA